MHTQIRIHLLCHQFGFAVTLSKIFGDHSSYGYPIKFEYEIKLFYSGDQNFNYEIRETVYSEIK